VREREEFTASSAYTYGQNTSRQEDGSSEETTTVDSAEARTQYNYFYTKKTYGLFTFAASRDEISRITYRLLAGPGLGHYWVRNDVWTFSGEMGAAVLTEEVGGVSDTYPALRVAQNFERHLNDHARVWQSLEYLPKAEDLDNFLVNAELGTEARLNGNLSLRVVLQNKYNSTPAETTKNNDFTLIAGLALKW
jgi:putative salt-induced outer membrane protein YdiY